MSDTKTPSQILSFIKQVFGTSIAITVVGIIVVLSVFGSMLFVYIKPYEVGVKQVNIGLQRGIQDDVLETGLHFVMPFGFEKVHTFPKTIQIFELSDNPTRYRYRQGKAANIQTSDGFFVNVDVSIMYQIKDPIKVIKSIGAGRMYIDNGLLPRVQPVLKDTLGQLTSEEFYNPYLRVEKMKLAKEKLQVEMEEKGFEILQVLIRYFRYSDEIQKNIEDKKLKDQLVFKNISEAKAAIEAAQLSKVIEEGEARVSVELQQGKAYVTKKNADKDLYVRTKKASADLLIKKAEAERTRLKNLALKGKGSENLVGLKMAEVLEGVEVIILPSDGEKGLNPLDLDSTLELID